MATAGAACRPRPTRPARWGPSAQGGKAAEWHPATRRAAGRGRRGTGTRAVLAAPEEPPGWCPPRCSPFGRGHVERGDHPASSRGGEAGNGGFQRGKTEGGNSLAGAARRVNIPPRRVGAWGRDRVARQQAALELECVGVLQERPRRVGGIQHALAGGLSGAGDGVASAAVAEHTR